MSLLELLMLMVKVEKEELFESVIIMKFRLSITFFFMIRVQKRESPLFLPVSLLVVPLGRDAMDSALTLGDHSLELLGLILERSVHWSWVVVDFWKVKAT